MRSMRRSRILICLAVSGSLAIPLASRAATTISRPAGGASQAMARVLPWIEDDYTRAVSQARARRLPIFVESWAPW